MKSDNNWIDVRFFFLSNCLQIILIFNALYEKKQNKVNYPIVIFCSKKCLMLFIVAEKKTLFSVSYRMTLKLFNIWYVTVYTVL